MIDQINELPEDELRPSPEMSRYAENKWISRKSQYKSLFLHLIDPGTRKYFGDWYCFNLFLLP